MFDGLAMMNEAELAEITRMIGVDKPPSSRDVLSDIVSGWLARAVRKEGKSKAEVERAVLEWTALAFKIPFEPSIDTNDLERAIRRKIAAEASAYLSPSWMITCALVASGKVDTVERKLTLLEQAASMAIPSQAALARHRSEWSKICARWRDVDPLPELRPHIATVAARSELGVECLTLGLALSLLDGGIPFPTERLFRALSDEFGLDRGQADSLQKRVNNLYWKHHNASQPTQARSGGYGDPIGAAARQTVYEAGALEALATDSRANLFLSLQPEAKKTGWSRMMGSLSGMSSFFSDKMKDSDQANLARVVYHTIVKQHVAVAAANVERREIEAERQARMAQAATAPPQPTPFTEPPPTPVAAQAIAPPNIAPPSPAIFPEEGEVSSPPPLAEKVEQPAVKRVIKLDL